METTFKNKLTLVTGASSGISKAMTLAFTKKETKVAVVDWKENDEMIDLIKEFGSEAIFIKCDGSKTNDVKAMVVQTIAAFGRLDYAFDNAEIEVAYASTLNCSEENWDETIRVNLKGVWLCMKYEIQEIVKQCQAVIVNCASGTIQMPMIDCLNGKTKEGFELFKGFEPVGRFGLPEEIANAVAWMCSDEATFVTGQVMALDGNFTAQ